MQLHRYWNPLGRVGEKVLGGSWSVPLASFLRRESLLFG